MSERRSERVEAPRGFSLVRTVTSHGWFDLPPFRWDEREGVLERPIIARTGRALLLSMREARPGVLEVAISRPGGRSTAAERKDAAVAARHMLRLDDTLEGFYSLCRRHPEYRWVPRTGAGRLLRAPTPFEDLVKLLCTTNCSWSLTRTMIVRLVDLLGGEIPGAPAARTFPTPEAMASRPARFYRDRIRAGYRAPHLLETARRVAGGGLDPSAWLEAGRSSEEISAEIMALPGAGPYVAENMLKLLGRYDGLGLDSWCRRKFSEMRGRRRRPSDESIRRHYSRFGSWRGLALWCDLTRDWSEGTGTEILRSQKY